MRNVTLAFSSNRFGNDDVFVSATMAVATSTRSCSTSSSGGPTSTGTPAGGRGRGGLKSGKWQYTTDGQEQTGK